MTRLSEKILHRSALVVVVGSLTMFAAVGAAGAAAIAPNAASGTVSAILPTSVLLSGSVNAEGTATTWHYQYGLATDPSYGSITASVSAGSATGTVDVSRPLTSLTPATSYHARIVATSSAGTTYGADVSFNTSAAPVVISGAATELTVTGATLNATVNPEAEATTWYFQYGPTTSYGTKSPAKKLSAGPNAIAVSAIVTGLASNQTYNFRIVATSSAGTSYGTNALLTTGLSVTLNVSQSTQIFGSSVQLSGTVTNGASGQSVTVKDEPFDQASFSILNTVTTGTGGVWSLVVKPSARTTFEASVAGGSSSPLIVSISPAVSLKVISGGQLSTSVSGEISFAGHIFQLQRLSGGLWVTWKHVLLNSNGRVTFATSLPKGRTTIRMAIAPFVPGINQAAPGYVAGYSRSISYLRS
jgi:hypothetical protein